MKRKDATVKLNILPSKEKDGKVPIIIQCFYKNKQKIKMTGVWVNAKHFDKKTERITSKEPNSATLNKFIQAIKKPLVERLDNYIENGIEYTLNDLFISGADAGDDVTTPNSLQSVAERLYKDKLSKPNTVIAFRASIRSIQDFTGGTVLISDINKQLLLDWRGWLVNEKKIANNTIRNYFSRMQALMSYASDNEIIQPASNPFIFFNFIKDISAKTKHKALSEEQLNVLISYFYTYYSVDQVSLQYCLMQSKLGRGGAFFSLKFWLIIFFLQGLSPKDVLLLKRSQFVEYKNEDTGDWYFKVVDVYRAKTGKKVVINVKKSLTVCMVFDDLLYTDNEYLIPFMNLKENQSDVAMNKRISNLNISFKIIIKNINEYINKKKIDVPQLNTSEITLYSARHTFASLLTKKGASLQDLAVMLGRDVNSISVYIKDFQTEDDVREVKDDLLPDF